VALAKEGSQMNATGSRRTAPLLVAAVAGRAVFWRAGRTWKLAAIAGQSSGSGRTAGPQLCRSAAL
jgi:hypothetical protein